jgi:hypothetical protein
MISGIFPLYCSSISRSKTCPRSSFGSAFRMLIVCVVCVDSMEDAYDSMPVIVIVRVICGLCLFVCWLV